MERSHLIVFRIGWTQFVQFRSNFGEMSLFRLLIENPIESKTEKYERDNAKEAGEGLCEEGWQYLHLNDPVKTSIPVRQTR